MRKSQITKVPFHKLITNTMTGGTYSFLLNPATLGSRLGVVADGFEEYRIIKLRFRLVRGGSTTSSQVAAFFPGLIDTSAGQLTDLSEVVQSTVLPIGASIPSSWVSVPKSVLSGPFSWYKSLASTLDSSEENQGTMAVAGTGTEAIQVELFGMMEFRGSSSTTNTPMLVALQRQRQRDRLLAILATPNTFPVPGGSKGTPNGPGLKQASLTGVPATPGQS